MGLLQHSVSTILDQFRLNYFRRTPITTQKKIKKERRRKLRWWVFLSIELPNHWDVLIGKGHQSAADNFLAVIPRKEPLRVVFGQDNVTFNRKLSSDLLIVENFFGRLGLLWPIPSIIGVWSEKLYDLIFSLGIAFKNYRIFYMGWDKQVANDLINIITD